jgi:hypothetical protein
VTPAFFHDSGQPNTDYTINDAYQPQTPIRLRGEGEVESGKVADAGAVERVAVPPGIEADGVERDGGEDVLQVGLLEAEVAGTSYPGPWAGLPAERSLCEPLTSSL